MSLLVLATAKPDEVRRATDEVLNRPEFSPANGSSPLEWIFERIGEWLAKLGLWAANNPGPAWVLIVILLIVLAALVVHIIYTFYRAFSRSGGDAGAGRKAALPFEVLGGAARDYRTGIRLALDALRAGDLRRAVWIGHRVLLGLLDEQGAVAFGPGKTNTTYLTECGPTTERYPLLRSLSDEYDQVIYAHRPGDTDRIAQRLAEVSRIAGERQ
jgi:hypothetical protein